MTGSLETPHGRLQLPVFLPDATRAVVRSVDSSDLESCGVQGIVVNTFHLLGGPGTRILASQGGVHGFMGWTGVVTADSGGFQIYSLLEHDPGLGSVSRKGFIYRTKKGGRKKILTSEKCIRRQFQLGADIMMCLDYCTHPDAPHEIQHDSVQNTVRWARECRDEFDKRLEKIRDDAGKPLLMAVIQGGADRELRKECADRLIEIGFDGYCYGGWPFDKDGSLIEPVEYTARMMPDDKPKFALGICGPEHIVSCVKMGYTLFDGALPTRDARRGRLCVFNSPPESAGKLPRKFYSRIYIQDEKFANDRKPVDESCSCLCCSRYTRAYLHHLFKIEDPLGFRLATIHNLRFYMRLMSALK